MVSPMFWLFYETSPGGEFKKEFQAVNLGEAKKKVREILRPIVLPTDRPGASVRWAYLEHLGEETRWPKTWLVQEAEG